MAIESMGLNVDVLAPDSENTILSEDLIIEFKQQYDAIVTIFDSDQPGIKAMKFYREKYGLPFVYISLEKDISDVVKVYGVKRSILEFIPKLHKAIETYCMWQED